MDDRRRHRPGSLGEFLADVRRAAAISRQMPWIPGIELGLGLLLAASNHLYALRPEDPGVAGIALLATVMSAAAVGWLGAQRLAFRAAMLGEPFGLGDVGRAIALQGWRFIRLGLLLLPVAAVGMAIMVLSIEDLFALEPTISLTGKVLLGVLAIAVGIVLTLVTPALAFEDGTARAAFSRGTERLRRHVRVLRWHAVVPPVLVVVGPAVLGFNEAVGSAAAVVVASLVFLARGAVVAAHLRIVELELSDKAPTRPVIL